MSSSPYEKIPPRPTSGSVNFYPPWMGPEKTAVWILILLLVGLIIAASTVPLYSCPGDAVGCVPETLAYDPASVGIPLRRVCTCNASTEIRVSTNARTLSNSIFAGILPTDQLDARKQSALSIVMAQFMLHDLYQPRPFGVANSSIPQPDPVFAASPSTDLVFDVPATAGVGFCEDPISDNTPVLDLSHVYGDGGTGIGVPYFRTGAHGLLNTSGTISFEGDEDLKTAMPPLASDGTYSIPDRRNAGSAGLLSMHVLAMRNHNYWAREVRRMRPTWTDSQLYWKARQINVAEWQHVVYQEWLPTLLGAIAPPKISLATAYDSGADVRADVEVVIVLLPAIINTMIPSAFTRRGSTASVTTAQYEQPNMVALPDVEGANGIIARLAQTRARLFDVHVANERRNRVNASNSYPIDHVANDIQLARVLRVPDWANIYSCYGPVPIGGDPRDAYQGFLAEDIYPGTSMGLTAGTIIASHFERTRSADPNFYSYTLNQEAIGKVFYTRVLQSTMWGLIVRNTRFATVDTSQQNPFVV